MSRRIKPGDVLEVTASVEERFYLQFLGKHSEYGDAVAVSPRPHRERPVIFEGTFENAYVTFYPASLAVRRGLAEIVGHIERGREVPTSLRRAGAREGTQVKTWVLETGQNARVAQALSAEERLLPIAAIWNHELLILRLRENWRPEHEG